MRSTKEKVQDATRQFQDRVQQAYRSRHYNRKSALLVFILNLVFACMIIAAGLFIFLNIQPYIRAVEMLANQALNYSLINFVMSLPLIGWLLGLIASIATTLIGVALWAIFQFFELLPWILTRDADTLRSLIERIERFEVLAVKPSDTPMVAALKERHNNIPIEWVAQATTYAAIAYTIDGLMNLVTYPPIKGGLDAVSLWLLAPSMADVDWGNLITVVITLIAVEVIVKLWHWLRQVFGYMRQQRQEQQDEAAQQSN
ncbi:hypothetical protein H6F67_18545 [Microcoleus sp. FACHB-1515]|uniref:hypothetical protein n=1 Tax=Cyanophyceae TaxID=3028117 RepID=UPI001689D473|nr:hypothetical protein [Microcoleus sp. FACHB-1515]MBD2091846.1 hypothetical protein [Microcoleus sp. FACHB-1515]